MFKVTTIGPVDPQYFDSYTLAKAYFDTRGKYTVMHAVLSDGTLQLVTGK